MNQKKENIDIQEGKREILIENLDSYAVPLTCRQYIKSIIDLKVSPHIRNRLMIR